MVLQGGFVELEDFLPKRTCVSAVGGNFAFSRVAPVGSPRRRSGRGGEAQRPVPSFLLLEPSLLLKLPSTTRVFGIRILWNNVGEVDMACVSDGTATPACALSARDGAAPVTLFCTEFTPANQFVQKKPVLPFKMHYVPCPVNLCYRSLRGTFG